MKPSRTVFKFIEFSEGDGEKRIIKFRIEESRAFH